MNKKFNLTENAYKIKDTALNIMLCILYLSFVFILLFLFAFTLQRYLPNSSIIFTIIVALICTALWFIIVGFPARDLL